MSHWDARLWKKRVTHENNYENIALLVDEDINEDISSFQTKSLT
jgi:hypothetical protein